MPLPVTPRSRLKYRFDPFWVIVGGLIVMLLISLTYFLLAERTNPAYNLMLQALDKLQEYHDYQIVISEEAGPETLSFEGQVHGINMSGYIPEHDLGVYLKRGEFYLRHKESETWEKAETIEGADLKNLEAFLSTPHQIIYWIEEYWEEAQTGPQKSNQDDIYKTIYWAVDSPRLWGNVFPAINLEYIHQGTVIMKISSQTFDVHKFKLALILKTPQGEQRRIQRTLTLDNSHD